MIGFKKEKYKNIKIFDLESDNLYFDVTKVHVTSIKSLNTGSLKSYIDPLKTIEELKKADLLVGHNIINYDLPVLEKLYGFKYEGDVFDTMIASMLIWPHIYELDIGLKRVLPQFKGKHSLEAWGYRLRCHKGDFGKQDNAWEVCTPEMITYCEQDVEVTEKIFLRELREDFSTNAIELEMDFAKIITKQVIHGFNFDVKKAERLYVKLLTRKLEILKEMQEIFPPIYLNKGEFTPKRDNKAKGYVANAPMTKIELTPFNPSARQQIANRFIKKYKWRPKVKTEGGQPKISEEVLMGLKYPEAKVLSEYFMLEKRLGMVGDGNNSWLKLHRNGRIHGGIRTIGARTTRTTSSRPNMQQVPAVGVPYGEECRALFIADEGWDLIGCDASALELVMLAHYMNDTQYIKAVEEGKKEEGTDVHTLNQTLAGLTTRKQAKSMIYCMNYGGGDSKLGEVVGGGKKQGKELRERLYESVPKLKKLTEDVKKAAKRKGYLKSIDGRKLMISSEHSALNYLLQGGGSTIVKQANIIMHNNLTTKYEGKFHQVGYVHDEVIVTCDPSITKDVAEIMAESFREAARHFKLRCKLDAEFMVGKDWSQTH